MSPDKQRIAIAEACGWTRFVLGCGVPPGHEKDWSDWVRPIPDYPADLNAMHEAEESLDDSWEGGRQCVKYAELLQSLFNKSRFGVVHATAAERAQAFLKTIGKWEE